MTKKMFALIVAITVLSAFVAGCNPPTETDKAGETAGATAGATAGGAAEKKTDAE
ncbi:MAG: hypothetical protein SFX74_06950 [Fimbriimonadaceae bacterium]|nr:hypothetical protein [Fimbriimonadaceae bacterium]